MQTTCGVDDNKVVAVVARVFQTLFYYLARVYLTHLENGDFRLSAYYFQLFDSRGAVNVGGDEQRSFHLFIFKIFRELRGVGGLTCTLQSAHHYNAGRLVRKIYLRVAVAHQRYQLFVYYLDDLLSGGKAA